MLYGGEWSRRRLRLEGGGVEAGLRDELLRFLRVRFANLPCIEVACEDIADEAFAAVLAGPRGTELAGSFAYMSAVAANLARRAWRRWRIEAGHLAGEVDPDGLWASAGEESPIFREEALAVIAASLEALREIERTVLRHRYWDDLAFAEIAQRTGLGLNTVLSLHRRALAKLRPLVSGYFREGAGDEGPISRDGLAQGPYSRFF